MSAPTPGPWTAEAGDVNCPHAIDAWGGVHARGYALADVYADIDLLPPDVAAANARLMAAAPDMLAVLRDLEWTGLNDGRGVTHLMCPACSARKSRGSGHNPYCGLAAAIAKAEGR